AHERKPIQRSSRGHEALTLFPRTRWDRVSLLTSAATRGHPMLDGTGRLQSDACMRFPSRCGPMLCLAILLWRVRGWPPPARAGGLEGYVSAPHTHYAGGGGRRPQTKNGHVKHPD